ncbi:MAG: hypothetical protein ACPGO5_01150 [Patescibacteria group bacterium]
MSTPTPIQTTRPSEIKLDPNYRSRFLRLTEAQQYRLLEMVPGFLVWATFIIAIVLSIVKPIWAIYFIIVFDLLWLIRIVYLLIHMIYSWFVLHKHIKIDWYEKLKTEKPNYKDYYHLVVYPTAGEPLEVIDKTFKGLAESEFDMKQVIVVLAGEERFEEQFMPIANTIKERYGHMFHTIFITVHPANVEGELAGKSANTHYAGKKVKEYIDEIGLDYDKVIVSSFDCDTIMHRKYLSVLTYKYISHPRPTRSSYQPVAIFNNNIWESSLFIRTFVNSTTFWLLTDLARPERLFTFSSHSMSFKALVDVNFWQKDIVSEDSRIFLQCFCHYDGDYEVTPLHVPVYMNTVWAGKFWPAMKAQYKQIQRWAWGVENFPYQAWYYLKVKNLPFKKGLHYLWNQLEGVYSWATAPILILIMGRLPLLVVDDQEKASVIAQNAPFVLENLMSIAMFGLFLNAVLSTLLMPERPKDVSRWRWLIIPIQWVVWPVMMIIFGSIPATDALTRMMVGKYLGFFVAPKASGQARHASNN